MCVSKHDDATRMQMRRDRNITWVHGQRNTIHDCNPTKHWAYRVAGHHDVERQRVDIVLFPQQRLALLLELDEARGGGRGLGLHVRHLEGDDEIECLETWTSMSERMANVVVV